MSATMTELSHGTKSAYRYHGCRCEPCREGRAERRRAARSRRPRPPRKPRPRKPMEHGTLYGYTTYRCRCDECRAARAAYQREVRARRAADAATAREADAPISQPAPCDLAAIRVLLERRVRALAGPAASRGAAGVEARARRAEIRELLDHLTREASR